MALVARVSTRRVFSRHLHSPFPSRLSPHAFIPLPSLSSPRLSARNRAVAACLSSSAPAVIDAHTAGRWKPMCLYHTQGKCTKMDDALHLAKFSHDFMVDLKATTGSLNKLRPQNLDYLLVLDLEGRVEILEFPVLMIDAKNMDFIDSFHRFVRPAVMSEQRIKEYIEGKYGKLGVDSGNWDLKTKIPEQCKVSKIKTPPYFMEWINLKDIYLNFYKRRATGMMTMMRELEIPMLGSHHLGIDDTKNIARVLQRMLADGVILQITAKRSSSAPGLINFQNFPEIKRFLHHFIGKMGSENAREELSERGKQNCAFLPCSWFRKPHFLFGVLMAASLSLPPSQFLLFPRRSPPAPPIPHPHLVSPPRKSTLCFSSSSTPSADASYPVVTEEAAEEEDDRSAVPLPREGFSTYEAESPVEGTEEPQFRGCKSCGREEIEKGCNGKGRIQGGIATVPGFGWWPIKAFRPCPGFVASGGLYRRQGQSMDEVAFGRGEREMPTKNINKPNSSKKKQGPSSLKR
ncbi:hypothetical protein MUK42_03299 [Musa troglodytarum]|uniref:Exonuclease domain-containing protein n=3 Tax=Musa troglodytarum TaxID=320322 RepID=A0A9E7HR81_9LILI|nr:hypothetical protein MUK42_03299 [Musa troglodytarum]